MSRLIRPLDLLKDNVLESLNNETTLTLESIKDAVDVLMRQIAEILARNPDTRQITRSQRQCQMTQPNVFLRLTQLEQALSDNIPYMVVEIILDNEKISILASDLDLGLRNDTKDPDGRLSFSFFTISNKGDDCYLGDLPHGFMFSIGDRNRFHRCFYSKTAAQDSIIIVARVSRELIPFLDNLLCRI